jgi:hypothetical protein
MGGPKSKPFLVKAKSRDTGRKRTASQTGEKIAQSGIYRVIHLNHRLPHEVTLLKDEEFPRCAQCQDAVQFQLVRGIKSMDTRDEFSTRICLYELPVLDREEPQEIAI